jgi:hypothetical protein
MIVVVFRYIAPEWTAYSLTHPALASPSTTTPAHGCNHSYDRTPTKERLAFYFTGTIACS